MPSGENTGDAMRPPAGMPDDGISPPSGSEKSVWGPGIAAASAPASTSQPAPCSEPGALSLMRKVPSGYRPPHAKRESCGYMKVSRSPLSRSYVDDAGLFDCCVTRREPSAQIGRAHV